jgi:hypothetical protein
MDNTNPQDGSKIILHTMEDDLKKTVPVAPVGSAPIAPNNSKVPPTAPQSPASFEVPNTFIEKKPVTVSGPSAPSGPSTASAIPQITIPQFNPLKKRIATISIFVGVVLIVFGLGVGLFFWIKSRSSQVAVTVPTPSATELLTSSLLPSVSPEASLIYPTPVAIFDGSVAVIEYQGNDDLNSVLASKLPLIAQEGKAIRILLKQTDYSGGPRFTYLNNILKAMGVLVNPELSKLMESSGDLFVYEDNGNYRLGFVSSLSGAENYPSLSSNLQKVESGFLSDFAPMFLSVNFQTPSLKNFKINSSISPNFVNRYINLINLPQNNLSLDYAINKSATLFILATSKNSMFHIINLIEGKK